MGFLDTLDSITASQSRRMEGADTAPARTASTGTGDAEVKEMQDAAPLLDLIESDTGEQGRASGDRIDFHKCPICYGHDCLRYYKTTNSWTCYSTHNQTGYKGGGYLEYRIASRGESMGAAMRDLRRETGRTTDNGGLGNEELVLGQMISGTAPVGGTVEADTAPTSTAKANAAKRRLPRPCHIRATDPPEAAPVLVSGLLRRGHVAMIAAKAKSSKSWASIDFALAVQAGRSWLGRSCAQGGVMYVDPELSESSMHRRFRKVADARDIPTETADAVLLWSLRGVSNADGKPANLLDVALDIDAMLAAGELARGQLSLIVVDSCSALMGGADENSSAEVRGFINTCLRIAEHTNAANLLVHHEGKALSGDRSAQDRGRGSSAWADAPDLLLSLVEVRPQSGEPGDYLARGERGFLLECAAVREFAPAEPVSLIWSYPVFRIDGGTTDGWKPRSSQQRAGQTSGDARKAKSAERATKCELALLAHMYRADVDPAEGIPASEAADICSGALETSVTTQSLKRYVTESEWLEVYKPSKQRWAVVPSHPKPIQLPRTT